MMHRTFDDATMDLPVAIVLIATAIAATLLIGIVAIVRQNRANARRAQQERLDDDHAWLRNPCDCTGCPCTGWIPVTWKDGTSGLVCAGDYANGQLRGYWA